MYHNQSIQIMYKPTFLERDDFGDRKRHQLPKSICFLNCVFLPCYFYTILPYLAMGSPGQLPTLPNGFPFVETRLTKEKKTRQTATGKGLLLSGWLCDISGDNHNKRQITARFTVSDKLAPRTPPTSPKICVSKREETMRQFGDNAHAQRDTW